MQYVPRGFEVRDGALIEAFVERYPFGTLIVVDDDGEPRIAHIPMQLGGGINGGSVVGHVARANPVAKLLLAGERGATAIFHGPHAHVSPLSYASAPAVPTWNFMVVHLQGSARTLDASASLEHMLQLSRAMEGEQGWKPESAPAGYIEDLARAIVAFRFPVERVSAKFKLSQNREEADRRRVIRALLDSDDARAQELAEWMRQLGLGSGAST